MRGMDERIQDAGSTPRYRWPWFLLGAIVLGIVMAVVWMAVEVHSVKEQRDNNRTGTQPVAEPGSPSSSRDVKAPTNDTFMERRARGTAA